MTKTDTDKKHSEWLVMVYAAGDNNLSANSIALMQDLEAADCTEEVRVLAAFDSATPIPQGARYLEIHRTLEATNGFRSIKWQLHNDLLTPDNTVVAPDFCAKPGKAAPNPKPATAEQALARFLDFVDKHYTADRYMLIVYGHGNLVAGNTFLSDTRPPSFLRLDSFAKILQEHFPPTINILGFANCEMNGIETAVELHEKVEFTIGSQGLMLALGWPFRKIVNEVGKNHDAATVDVAKQILRVCARNLVDFTLMDRSSEQAICDVTKFGGQGKLVSDVKKLSRHLQDGLALKDHTDAVTKDEIGTVRFPIVRDVVRLARLEAQAYFGEVFVDLYDFCEQLVLKCNDVLGNVNSLVFTLLNNAVPKHDDSPTNRKQFLLGWKDLAALEAIADSAWQVLETFRQEHIIPDAYYVCPELQYSHGLSIFFPWTLPQSPITFEPEKGRGAQPGSIQLTTPFDVYKQYKFAGAEYGHWAAFLEAFFRATLRNVRQAEVIYKPDNRLFFEIDKAATREESPPAVDLRKTDSTGETDDCTCPQIKNYPRRFYISPADCERRLPIFGLPDSPAPTESNVRETGKVSYLGWNIRGVVAEVIGLDGAPGAAPEPPDPCQ